MSYGYQSMSYGYQSMSYWYQSMSYGYQSMSYGYQSMSYGYQSMSYGYQSMSYGYQSMSYGYQSMSYGYQSVYIIDFSASFQNMKICTLMLSRIYFLKFICRFRFSITKSTFFIRDYSTPSTYTFFFLFSFLLIWFDPQTGVTGFQVFLCFVFQILFFYRFCDAIPESVSILSYRNYKTFKMYLIVFVMFFSPWG